MSNEIATAVVENAAEEVVTEAAKQSWSAPEITVLVLAGIGGYTAGKFVGKLLVKGYHGIMNLIESRKEINKAYETECAPVVDIQDCKEVEDSKGKPAKK